MTDLRHRVMQRGPYTLVPLWCATSVEQRAALPQFEAIQVTEGVAYGDPVYARQNLIPIYEAIIGDYPDRPCDHPTTFYTRHALDAVREGRLLVIRGWYGFDDYEGVAREEHEGEVRLTKLITAGRGNLTAELCNLVKKIEKQTGGGKLSFRGRQYKLVADVDLGKMPSRNDYEIVGQVEARSILDGMAKEPAELPLNRGKDHSLASLLGMAASKLTRDWRPPLEPNGLILLRRSLVLASAATVEEPALTPSQLLKTKKTGWITINVEDQSGAPWRGNLRLRLPDGVERTHSLDAHGTVHLDAIEPGTVQLKLLFPAPTTHTVLQGESLPSIAALYGRSDWKPIYEHADNADLRGKRPNPNVLHPGDRIVIPPVKDEWLLRSTNQSHTIVIHLPEVRLRLRLHDVDGKAFANAKYRLEIDTVTHEGQTSSDGFVDQPIPVTARTGTLTFWPSSPSGPTCEIPLAFGHLDPATETSGIQARLANLGFYTGPIDGSESEDLTGAITLFQTENGLEATGAADDSTLAKLREKHDGG